MIYLFIACALLVLELVITNNRINDLEEEAEKIRKLVMAWRESENRQVELNKNVFKFNEEVANTLRTHEELIKQLVIHTDGFEEK